MKGMVLGYSERNKTGIILNEKEQRYTFSINNWKENKPPRKNDLVDFIDEDNTAKEIYLINGPTNFNDFMLMETDTSKNNYMKIWQNLVWLKLNFIWA